MIKVQVTSNQSISSELSDNRSEIASPTEGALTASNRSTAWKLTNTHSGSLAKRVIETNQQQQATGEDIQNENET
ncbi:hypothetical protein Trydic_g8143 [Trypoxylus dichotomus]